MGTVPDAYFQFIMHYAPFVYVIPTAIGSDAAAGQKNVTVTTGANFESGYPVQISDGLNSEWNLVSSVVGNVVTMQNNLQHTYHAAAGKVEGPEPAYGRGVMSASFALDFLVQAYSASQFAGQKTAILAKIVELADWILTQQCVNAAKKAYGGFASAEESTQYWSIDAGRCILALLSAYQVTGDSRYLAAAKLCGGTFLKTVQDEQVYGGFARAVAIDDNWLYELDTESLYCLIGLKRLIDVDPSNAALYRGIADKAIAFLRSGVENLWLYFEPADSQWHRVGLTENEIYDDSLGFALLGLYIYEGWSDTCRNVYNSLQGIKAPAEFPAYNPAICWPGYIDVKNRSPACAYYDDVTSGILWRIRAAHDKPSLYFSVLVAEKYQAEFMNWGPLFTDYSPITPAKAMANVSWLAQLFLNYVNPASPFARILTSKGENLTLYPLKGAGASSSYGNALTVKAVVAASTAEELIFEVGYTQQDYITVYGLASLRMHDKVRRAGVDYEVQTVQPFLVNGDPEFFKCACRRLING
jgi:hypothetical protein